MAVLHVTSENFESEVLESDKPVLIDFWATWCGPCQMIAPIIEELGEELTDVKVVKIDVDQNAAIAQRFNVVSIPTLILMDRGAVVNKTLGFQSREALIRFIGK